MNDVRIMQKHLLIRIKNQYGQVDDLIKGLSVKFITDRHLPDKWSIKEHLSHLGRYQEIFEERICRILKEETLVFDRYKAENDSFFAEWIALNVQEVVEKTKEKRSAIYQWLTQIEKEQLSRTGIHPKFGVLSINEWTEFFLLHETHHFYSIFQIIHEFKSS